MYTDPFFMIIMAVGGGLAMLAQWKVKSAFNTWSTVRTRGDLTGAEIARRILEANDIHDVKVEQVDGFLSDHYDPRNKVLRLSPDVYNQPSVAAVGVAAHEVGHAIQHARNYRWLGMRSAMVPVLGFTNRTALPVMMLGGVLYSAGQFGLGQLAMIIGVGLFSVMVLFQLVTLPVEFDASRRALAAIDDHGMVTGDEHEGAQAVLTAAALTYVAGAVQSLLKLLYFAQRAGLFNRRR